MAKTAIYWLAQLGTAAACALLGCLAAVGLAKVFWWLANGAERLGMMESGSIRMVHGGTMATSLGPIIVALVFRHREGADHRNIDSKGIRVEKCRPFTSRASDRPESCARSRCPSSPSRGRKRRTRRACAVDNGP